MIMNSLPENWRIMEFLKHYGVMKYGRSPEVLNSLSLPFLDLKLKFLSLHIIKFKKIKPWYFRIFSTKNSCFFSCPSLRPLTILREAITIGFGRGRTTRNLWKRKKLYAERHKYCFLGKWKFNEKYCLFYDYFIVFNLLHILMPKYFLNFFI